jgi:hypothetical protein
MGSNKSQLDALTTGSGLLQQLMTKYGIDKAYAQSILDRKSNEKIAKWQVDAANRRSASSGSSGGTSNSSGGFEIL